ERTDVGAVDCRPGEAQGVRTTEPGQERFVEPGPHAGLGPLGQAPPAGHARTETKFRWRVFPGDPGVQHEQDPPETPACPDAACAPDAGPDVSLGVLRRAGPHPRSGVRSATRPWCQWGTRSVEVGVAKTSSRLVASMARSNQRSRSGRSVQVVTR